MTRDIAQCQWQVEMTTGQLSCKILFASRQANSEIIK